MTTTEHQTPKGPTPIAHRKVVAICGAVVLSMLGLAYASVPLYRLFCQITGFAGTTMRADAPPAEISDRTVTVRFDANVNPGIAWRFEPLTAPMTIRLGETAVATYRATNVGTAPTIGTASYNVVPDQAGSFFNKLECFCFTEQALAPGQSIDMPVQFFVDPAMARDSDGKRISLITLSYTFHPVSAPAKGVAETAKAVKREGSGS